MLMTKMMVLMTMTLAKMMINDDDDDYVDCVDNNTYVEHNDDEDVDDNVDAF